MLSEHLVGPVDDLPDNAVAVVQVGDAEVGVVRLGGTLRAYENRCPHQGGPVCCGRLVGHQEGVLDDEQRLVGERLSSERFDLVCPWHGWSYDALTGENVGDRRFRLRRWDVAVRDGNVYVLHPQNG